MFVINCVKYITKLIILFGALSILFIMWCLIFLAATYREWPTLGISCALERSSLSTCSKGEHKILVPETCAGDLFSLSPNFKNSLKPVLKPAHNEDKANVLWWGGAIVSLHFFQGVCLFLSPFLLSPSVILSLIHCLTHRLMPHLFFSDHQTFGFHIICYNVMILLCSWFVFWKICCMQKFSCN